MKNLLKYLLLSLSVVCAFAAFGQNSAAPVKFNQTVWDFGKIKETAGVVSHTFEFTNVSKSPYIIEFVSVSCGCTTPEYGKAPVLPGKKGTIKISYDPKGRPGAFEREVVVTANNRRSQIKLVVKGEVEARPRTPQEDYPVSLGDGLRATSESMIFGYVNRGEIRSQTANIFNDGTSTVRLSAVVEGDAKEYVSVKFEPETLKPKERGYMTVTYNLINANMWGVLSSQIKPVINGKSASADITAYATVVEDFSNVSAENAPKASFSTQFHHFGQVKRGTVRQFDFTLTNEGQSPLIIRDIKANGNRISYTIEKTTIQPGQSTVLKATADFRNFTGRMSESITVIMNDPSRPMRELRLAANVE